uniref:Uncharacterized protein n=1 Tax=Anguilla anguilla TaxID=7936 RepID=A0A0E9RPE8_ANGAN
MQYLPKQRNPFIMNLSSISKC